VGKGQKKKKRGRGGHSVFKKASRRGKEAVLNYLKTSGRARKKKKNVEGKGGKEGEVWNIR